MGDKLKEGLMKIDLDTGCLSQEQINLMLKHLPIEITFIDKDDNIQYFSANEKLIFARTANIIGRDVRKCHPAKSRARVNQVIESLKDGTKDVTDFWIHMKGRFIYIRYFAVRDEGVYQGILQVTQDVTDIRILEGEKRRGG